MKEDRFLIINADDFGASSGVNRAVRDAHAAGTLTSASLMVTGAASNEAVEMARTMTGFSLGIHIDLTGEGGPSRVDLGDVSDVATEARRQIQVFRMLVGRDPSHVDVHHNLHRDAVLAPAFVAVASEIGVPLRENSRVRYFPDFYAQWDGEVHPEQVSPENLRTMLSLLDARVTELACHPGYVDPAFESEYHIERALEIDTLLDPALAADIRALGFRLIDYDQLAAMDIGEL